MKNGEFIVREAAKSNKRFIAATLLGFLLFSSNIYGQRPVRPRSMRPTTGLDSAAVVVYENPGFRGRNAMLPIGETVVSGWKPSSIKVPQGLVAILYERANAGGVNVDLMEDQTDLSRFGLAGNVSRISVFSAQRGGLFWARNSMQNGQFVAGHWERARAGGNAVNTVAVASPGMPGRPPEGPTNIQASDAQFTITSLGVQSPADDALWNHAMTDLMGIIGSDFRGVEEIGSAAFERASNNIAIPDAFNVWFPQRQPRDQRRIVYFKRTLAGTIGGRVVRHGKRTVPDAQGVPHEVDLEYSVSSPPHIADISGTYEDYDVNIDIIPYPEYAYLINDAHPPEKGALQSAKEVPYPEDDPCTDPFMIVEAEIDARPAAKATLRDLLVPRVGKHLAVYGPWIYDTFHCHHPEVHPAEEIWWTDRADPDRPQYHLNVFCDASKRFWWRRQMDDGTKLKPWGAPPIKGVFAIAFEVPIDMSPVAGARASQPGRKFEVTNISDYNVAVIPNADKTYNLVYQGNILVSFVPHNDAFKVSFENVGLKPGAVNVVRGFLVIETTVGSAQQIATSIPVAHPNGQVTTVNIPEGSDPNTVDQRYEDRAFRKVEGHYMFTVVQTAITAPVIRQ